MSELERVRRLSVFVDEDQWARAFEAALREVDLLICNGLLLAEFPPGESVRTVATRIATAALRAATEDAEGDITDVSGVHIDEISSQTGTSSPISRHRRLHRDRPARKDDE